MSLNDDFERFQRLHNPGAQYNADTDSVYEDTSNENAHWATGGVSIDVPNPKQTVSDVERLLNFMVQENRRRDDLMERLFSRMSPSPAESASSQSTAYHIMPDLSKSISTFDGEGGSSEARAWFNTIKSMQQLHNWPGSFALEAARANLRGGALHWFNSRSEQLNSWEFFSDTREQLLVGLWSKELCSLVAAMPEKDKDTDDLLHDILSQEKFLQQRYERVKANKIMNPQVDKKINDRQKFNPEKKQDITQARESIVTTKSEQGQRRLPARNAEARVTLKKIEDDNLKYFKEARIGGKSIQSYVDQGSKCVLLRKSDADDLELVYEPVDTKIVIKGYGSGKVNPYGKIQAEIEVDEAKAKTEILIVPNDAQNIPLLIGQPFTEQKHIVIVRRRSTLRLFNEPLVTEEQDDETKISLCAKDKIVIPPNYVGFVTMMTEPPTLNDLYIETHIKDNKILPRCIARPDEQYEVTLPINNLSQQDIVMEQGENVLRANNCEENQDDHAILIEVCTVDKDEFSRVKKILSQCEIGEDVTQNQREKLEELIGDFSHTFDLSVNEIGCYMDTKMEIALTSEEKITYRPYRLGKVRGRTLGQMADCKQRSLVNLNLTIFSTYYIVRLVVGIETEMERDGLQVDCAVMQKAIWAILLLTTAVDYQFVSSAYVSYNDLMKCSYGERGSLTATCVNATASYFKTTSYRFDQLDETLRCMNCTLKTLDSGTFDISGNQIRNLDLTKSQIETMKQKSFVGLIFLENLDLSYNSIRSIYPGTFTGVKKIKYINLSNNQINILSDDGFQELLNLEILNLENNTIQTISTRAFSGLAKLRELNLKNNQIMSLKGTEFFNLTALLEINLANNKLQSPVIEFHEQSVLRRLLLQNNLIDKIAPRFLKGLHALENLDLSYNQINEVNQKTLQSLYNLRNLNISYNKLTTFQTGTYSGLPQLEILNCSHNNIDNIEITGVFSLHSLHALDLSYNSISDLDYVGLISRLPRLSYLRLDSNLLHCDLENEMNTYFAEDNFKFVLYDNSLGSTKCVDTPSTHTRITEPDEFMAEITPIKKGISSAEITIIVLICIIFVCIGFLFYLQFRTYQELRFSTPNRATSSVHLMSTDLDA
ncbi:hypothetical protein NQ314_010567 [Rhamnusium bicolor]|uniref:Uncharacterized protein n=1 Tax=Rhamnusium bicolor TaxID=1586634 RepID=A0AAV8XQP2_9CUCU|nr:hypothetical protein NQ314_010567 [Rhamnusium bicolor]